ncbi:uncharacterized protein TRAVEDRAFT_35644 [Trametes versicolor FP-101664 SS1]|uniref:uncharacterized protein n=1 Tax=Trametes versicolor (strain FP-101664) TaxID=717944 RepID=UPI000462272D|nr:uncharacterized protein TRAVEDRAFT_35644 [Trametes versicolor FP-101664 SS1]EIW62287.1 hypothetical protein TRAVEDRAFT_35644 [Trametes versicolor FP-101664 SS1]
MLPPCLPHSEPASSSTLLDTAFNNALIDPSLLGLQGNPASCTATTLLGQAVQPSEEEGDGICPVIDGSGRRVSREAFLVHLQTYKRKERLRSACHAYGLSAPKSANLEALRARLLSFWYGFQASGCNVPGAFPSSTLASTLSDTPLPLSSSTTLGSAPSTSASADQSGFDDEDTLVSQFDVEGHGTALLGYDRDGLDEEDEDLDDPEDTGSDEAFHRFQTKTRVDAAQRFEDNRRAGGKKTQQANVKAWKIFLNEALAKGHIRDDIVDEHALLLYINCTADRCKRDRKGDAILGTRVGASQIKKEFFGALRVRKAQEAHNPSLARKRPATTMRVYDLVKARMDEALRRARLGLIPAQDAPDIIANTFLEQVTDDQLFKIRLGFLEHCELHSTIKGFLAWTLCSASGKRGDDIRALKLCELQPYVLVHPDKLTHISAILGLQAEDKTGHRGMKTVRDYGMFSAPVMDSECIQQMVNPRYTCWIAHRDPHQCPLGALTFLLHFVHDQYELGRKLDIQWTVNKTWRQVRLIFGSSPNTPYNEHNLYNLYCQAFKKAEFESGIKAHLPRHILGYQQERLGVDSTETMRLGWARDTYTDVYAPSLPKKAILACHRYMDHEDYAPTRLQVPVPPAFLVRMCPMAEEIISSVDGVANLVGTTNHWKMVVGLRPHLFLCAAALYQVRPGSPIFRLPALAHDDVKLWMKTEFPSQILTLDASVGDPISVERLQNVLLRQSLQHVVVLLQGQRREVAHLHAVIDRRTAAFSPPRIDITTSHEPTRTRGMVLQFDLSRQLSLLQLEPSVFVDAQTRTRQDSGVYEAEDSTLRAFVAPSPASPILGRQRTEVDLVLPPSAAFTSPGQPLRLPNFGKGSVTWEAVFGSIRQPSYLWDVWRPSRTLDRSTIQDLWDCYNTGEIMRDEGGAPVAMKPPLRLVEQRFLSTWWKTAAARKAWQRLREIPEWIENTAKVQCLTPEDAIALLEERRHSKGPAGSKGLSTLVSELAEERKRQVMHTPNAPQPSNTSPSPSPRTSPAPPGSSQPSSASSGSTGKRKRAPAVGARSKKRKPTLALAR